MRTRNYTALALMLALASVASAAISATTQWDVRTTGSNNNGGGYDASVGVPGTDYSQQNGAQYAFTDLVIGGTTTQFTSALNPVVAGMVGNVINITGGAGCTTGRYLMLSQAAGTATMDRSMGTGASTCTGNLGGSLLTVQQAFTSSAAGNAIWIKAGTYTVTATITDGGSGKNTSFYGYSATHADWSTKPVITTATNSTPLFSFAGGYITFRNVSMTNTAVTRATAIQADGNFPSLVVMGCYFERQTTGIDNVGGNFAGISVFNSEFYNFSVTGISSNFRMSVFGSYFHGGTNNVSGAAVSTSGTPAMVAFNVFYSNLAYGVLNNGSSTFVLNNVFHTQRSAFFAGSTDGGTIANNVFWNTSGIAVEVNNLAATQANNAFGSNGTNRSLGTNVAAPTLAGWGDITLTVDPFVSAAGGNFALNATAGGGALLKAAGFPGVAPFGTGALDVGAVQSAGSSATQTAKVWIQ